ncbi:MAG: hypothetical protein EXS22_06530 [Pedosphaera sp.]|nr:hypothetical protein [Pedosphaera sp.]MSU43678.1 hypothetical protein [Pedosphaera sp.]
MSVSDCFALLQEARQPWLDAVLLKEKFLALSARTHPDRFTDAQEKAAAQSRFAEINAAHETLRDTKRRLQHLLTLERGAKPADIHDIPAAMAEVFIEVLQLLKSVDGFLAARDAQPSALLKARQYATALEWLERVEILQARLAQQHHALEAQLRALSQSWAGATADLLAQVESHYHQASYLARWRQQLQERALQLGL